MSKYKEIEAIIKKWKKDAEIKAAIFDVFFEHMEVGKIYSASDHPILKEYGYVYAWKIDTKNGTPFLDGISEADNEKLKKFRKVEES